MSDLAEMHANGGIRGRIERVAANMAEADRREREELPPEHADFEDWDPSDEDDPKAAPSETKLQATPPPELWRVHGVADIFAPLPPINWLVEGIDFCPGAVNMVAGYGFTGKTIALQDMALCTVAGEKIWGCFTGRRGPVLHVDYEQGTRLTFERYQRLARAHGVGPQDLAGLEVVSMPGLYLDGSVGFEQLTRDADGCALLLVDSLRAATPGIEENDSKIRLALDQLTRVSEKTGATVVLIHHARKPAKDAAGGAKMAIRGSGALFDACASVLVFEAGKGEPVRVSHEKARTSGRLAADFLLRIVDTEIDGNTRGGLMVVAEGAPPKAADRTPSERLAELRTRILELCKGRPEGFRSRNDIITTLGSKRSDTLAAINELLDSGELVEFVAGRNRRISCPP